MLTLHLEPSIDVIDPATGNPIKPFDLKLDIPNDQVRGFIEFFACMATKTDVLIPAIVATVACISSASPPQKPG